MMITAEEKKYRALLNEDDKPLNKKSLQLGN